MKEEEIIKQLNSLILEKRYYTEYHAWVGTKTFEAIQGLLDLYEKEKEKNETLEELLQGRLFELYKYYKDLASEYQANCISKNKIKPIQIIDLDGKIHNVYKIEEE